MTPSPTFSSDGSSTNGAKMIKFLYSYGGKILPRQTDGELRYVGGHTRVLAVDRSVTFAELMVRFGELCGSSVSLKCKLPSEDLDVLVSISSDEDLANVIDEYDRFSSSMRKGLKIRAVLFPIKSIKKISPPTSTVSSIDWYGTTSPPHRITKLCPAAPHVAWEAYRCGGRNILPDFGFSAGIRKDAVRFRYFPLCDEGSPRLLFRVPRWNHCQ